MLRDVGNSMLWQYGMSALINFQFHVIGRIDDTTQVLIDHLRVHDLFSNWSKNVGDERDAPWQIILGSMDTTYCVLVSLAIWMEMNMHANASAGVLPYVFSFSNDVDVPSGGQKVKNIAQYDDEELPYPDAEVAEKLCIGGACFFCFQMKIRVSMAVSLMTLLESTLK